MSMPIKICIKTSKIFYTTERTYSILLSVTVECGRAHAHHNRLTFRHRYQCGPLKLRKCVFVHFLLHQICGEFMVVERETDYAEGRRRALFLIKKNNVSHGKHMNRKNNGVAMCAKMCRYALIWLAVSFVCCSPRSYSEICCLRQIYWKHDKCRRFIGGSASAFRVYWRSTQCARANRQCENYHPKKWCPVRHGSWGIQ